VIETSLFFIEDNISTARDGSVALRPLLPRTEGNVMSAQAVGALSNCWRLHVHSGDTHVTGVALTQDKASLITAGDDGNLLLFDVAPGLHRVAVEELAAEAGARHLADMDLESQRVVVAPPPAEDVAEPEDITDPKHYSIQQEKIQAEEDRRMQASP
jgi:hypothetical protein